jgi:hypothetical protein
VGLTGSKILCVVTNMEKLTGTTSMSVSVDGILVGMSVFASVDGVGVAILVGMSLPWPVDDSPVGMSVFASVVGVGVTVGMGVGIPVSTGGVPMGILVGIPVFASVGGVAMGILVGVSVFVPLSVGSRVGDDGLLVTVVVVLEGAMVEG